MKSRPIKHHHSFAASGSPQSSPLRSAVSSTENTQSGPSNFATSATDRMAMTSSEESCRPKRSSRVSTGAGGKTVPDGICPDRCRFRDCVLRSPGRFRQDRARHPHPLRCTPLARCQPFVAQHCEDDVIDGIAALGMQGVLAQNSLGFETQGPVASA